MHSLGLPEKPSAGNWESKVIKQNKLIYQGDEFSLTFINLLTKRKQKINIWSRYRTQSRVLRSYILHELRYLKPVSLGSFLEHVFYRAWSRPK